MKNERMLREASPWKQLVTMGLPIIVVMIVNVLYNMADVFFMGQTGDTIQVAAISLSGPAFTIFSGLGTLFGSGACTAIAMALGKGDREKVRKYTAFCTWGSVASGIVISCLMFIFMKPLLGIMGTDSQTAPFAKTYLTVIAAGSPFLMLTGSLGNALRADGSSGKVMLIALLGNFVNILMDPLFILVFGWGIAGAAWATVLGNAASGILLILMVRKSKVFSISFRHFTLKREIALKVLSLGLPMASSTVMMCFSAMMCNSLLVRYGNVSVAANSVAGKAPMLVAMIAMGICMGMQPAMAYSYGSGDKRRLRSTVAVTGIATVSVSVILAGIFLIAREGFMAAFLNDPEVIRTGKLMMLPLLGAPISGIYQLCTSYLQSADKAGRATLAALLNKGIVYIPVLFVSQAVAGLPGLIFSGLITDVISTAASLMLCKLPQKKKASPATAPGIA